MKRLLPALLLVLLFSSKASAQPSLKQYFDGADTLPANSLIIIKDTAFGNIWQVGKPRKSIFKAAATVPNVIITDTINNYPVNNTSRFTITFKDSVFFGYPFVAVRWKQKLHMQKKEDGGIVEFSKNGGPWQNVFNNSGVYNLYGYLQSNKDTLNSGEYAFSGTDTVWKDIWLCFRGLTISDSMAIRFTLKTDSTNNSKEGWMIDNMLVQRTLVHTVGQTGSGRDSKLYPTSTNGIIYIEAEHVTQNHDITSVLIYDANARIVQEHHDIKQRYMIDLAGLPAGEYFVRVTTNLGKETFTVLLHH
jgi:hypothetical protein